MRWVMILTWWQNTYLIAINVTNKQKERYYHEYVPELLDVRLLSLPFPACRIALGTYADLTVSAIRLRSEDGHLE